MAFKNAKFIKPKDEFKKEFSESNSSSVFYKKFNLDKVMIAIAKSQYILGNGKEVTVKNVRLNNGAGFITVYLDDIMTMPGLSKKPAYLGMNIDDKGNISGLF